MYDKTLVLEILCQISDAIKTIKQRFEPIKNVNDFTDTPRGMEKLDSICMLLIAVGESLKNIDKITDKKLFLDYIEVDWRGAKGMRDIISHHYFDIDAEEIYNVCDAKLSLLFETIEIIIADLNR
jgi:uncharacterized protein with HEPN domain